MERRAGILRTIRRQWSPYRVYPDNINDHVYAEEGVQRKTAIELLDKFYFFVEYPIAEGGALYDGESVLETAGPDAPPLEDTVFRLWDPLTNPDGPRTLQIESHRLYAAIEDVSQTDDAGNIFWDGSTLSVSGWSVLSPYHRGVSRFHETMILTRGNNLQTLVAQHDRNGTPYVVGDFEVFKPWVNAGVNIGRLSGVQFATVLTATGSWQGATNLVIARSDRPSPFRDEFVAYVWRGYGGERPRNPIGTGN
jgi:hypothetical protein